MPTYEYKCPDCDFQFEEFQSIVSEPITVCPKCRGTNVKRLINGGVGLIFKGSGFYITDYGRGASKNGAPPGQSDSKTESKGAGKDKKATKKKGD